jgi:hypothetical protein
MPSEMALEMGHGGNDRPSVRDVRNRFAVKRPGAADA